MIFTLWFLKSDQRIVSGINKTIALKSQEPLEKGKVGVGAPGAEL